MGGFGFLGLLFLAWVIFSVYFIFKTLQFVMTATDLYKKIIQKEEDILRLLLDIRDNTKLYNEGLVKAEKPSQQEAA